MSSKWPVVLFFSVSPSLASDLSEITVALHAGNYRKSSGLDGIGAKECTPQRKTLNLGRRRGRGLG